MYTSNSPMARRSGQSMVAIIGAFIILTILSYYSWSLSSENNVLKGTIVMSYKKLKDLATHKAGLEKKNLLLSNRMVEMEEAKDTEKQNAETEQEQRLKCEAKLKKSDDECSVKVGQAHDKKARCEDASVQRESFLMEALNGVHIKSLDHAAQADIVMAKIKHLKGLLKSSQRDYIALQNKFSDLEKEKISLEEANKQLSTRATENKKIEIDSTSSIAGKVEGTKKNVEKKRKSEKDGNTNQNQSISKDKDDLKTTANVTKPDQHKKQKRKTKNRKKNKSHTIGKATFAMPTTPTTSSTDLVTSAAVEKHASTPATTEKAATHEYEASDTPDLQHTRDSKADFDHHENEANEVTNNDSDMDLENQSFELKRAVDHPSYKKKMEAQKSHISSKSNAVDGMAASILPVSEDNYIEHIDNEDPTTALEGAAGSKSIKSKREKRRKAKKDVISSETALGDNSNDESP